MTTILEGISIGVGVGLTLMTVQAIHIAHCFHRDSKRIKSWLEEYTSNEAGAQFRTTRTIASWCNLTEDRVREVASRSTKIFQSAGEKPDLWGVYEHVERSVYENRGFRSV